MKAGFRILTRVELNQHVPAEVHFTQQFTRLTEILHIQESYDGRDESTAQANNNDVEAASEANQPQQTDDSEDQTEQGAVTLVSRV